MPTHAILRAFVCSLLFFWTFGHAAETPPLRALLVAGGCCHDYAAQHQILRRGLQERAYVRVDVVWTDDKSVTPPLAIYNNADWAAGYDVVIHDECAAGVRDLALLKRILNVHKTVPAVHLHCSMHSFRTGTDDWFRHLGLQSTSHGPQEPIAITFVDKVHPITQPLGDWTTGKEELYNNVRLLDAHPLAMGRQVVNEKSGGTKTVDYVVAWTNEKQGARSFSTTLGHNNATVQDARYLDLVARGLLWACGKLEPTYLRPYKGEGKTTFVKANPPEPKPAAAAPPPAPKGATLVTATASTEEANKSNFAWRAVDGDEATRWCASDGSYPQWLQLELDTPRQLSGISLSWENNGVYRYKVEGSANGILWTTLVDGSANSAPAPYNHEFAKTGALRLVRIHALGKTSGGWASIREVKLTGEGIGPLAPKLNAEQKANADKAAKADADPYKSGGNVAPRIVKLTAEEEQRYLGDVKVANGFEVTLFAPPQTANYPVFVAATPDGTLFVSSDGNGSIGRNPHRGRVLRLRDLDNDGRADEVKEFIKDVDAPRGLVWDHDRLYLVHPPHLSAYIDHDRDGVADEEKLLVKNIAFGYDKRPADHTTNGLGLGIDGWLYIAVGDFGFMNAEGTDGRRLTHRGGGVARVRPDGTGLEMYSTGTRNILEVAISPRMELFARDNTNDGGGWNVRFHHFTGLDDHGYPRLFKNFPEEYVAPLADYGGGSGCGAVYIDEPGFGEEWNDAPFTCDWGTGALYKHTVRPKGATFEETRPPEPFIKMTRPTDADVDALSRVYCASWKGATFNWEGPDVGYIVCVKPKGHTPEPLPDFAKLNDQELVRLLDSPSHRRRLEAKGHLERRGNPAARQFLAGLSEGKTEERKLVQELVRMVESGGEATEPMRHLGSPDPIVSHTAIQALIKMNRPKDVALALSITLAHQNDTATREWTLQVLRALRGMHSPEVVEFLLEPPPAADAESGALRRAVLAALCRLHFREGEWNGDSWGTRPDTRGPYYQPEAWSETPRIMAALKEALAKAAPEEAAFLVREMNRNRIQSTEALARILALARQDPKVVPDAVARLATAETVPAEGVALLLRAVQTSADPATLSQAVLALAKTDSAEGCRESLRALAGLTKLAGAGKELEAARNAFFTAPKLENHHQLLEAEAVKVGEPGAKWADMALLTLSQRKDGSPEARELSTKALEAGWTNPRRRAQLIEAIRETKAFTWGDKVLAAVNDPDPKVAKAAQNAVQQLKLQPKAADSGPLVGSLTPDQVVAKVLGMRGDLALGEQIFSRQTCAACHTVRETDPPKGPYLGNIAQTYKRPDLALNILDPNKTIAQGFASEVITLKDGTQQMGFITLESAETVKLRNVAAQEFAFASKDIKERQKLPFSIMPPGLVAGLTLREFASLLDYLEALAKK